MLIKNTLLFFALVCSFNYGGGQYFKVETIEKVESWMESMVPQGTPPYHKIRIKDDSSELGLIVYPPYSERDFSQEELTKMIEELLLFKGDTRTCFVKIKCTGKGNYSGALTQYSLQLEALYIINSLFFENFTEYAPCPVLVETATNKEASIDGPILEKAYAAYEAWFQKVKETGFANARAEKLDPLANSGLKWYK